MKSDSDSTRRFSNRVEDYVRYRPGYPREVIRLLAAEHGLTPAAAVADIGSGTGLLTRLFLENGNRVYGVEPNAEMRGAGETYLAAFPPERFASLDGTAEATGLPEASVDWVAAGQAFHWFDHPAARREFARILRPGGQVLLIWNLAEDGASPAIEAFYGLCEEFGQDFAKVRQSWRVEGIGGFFTAGHREYTLDNEQRFDFEGLRGRLLSSSYIPREGPRVPEMLDRLRHIFERYAEGGFFRFPYRTRMYVGTLPPRPEN
jgi:SAM-dependent methyltransferase